MHWTIVWRWSHHLHITLHYITAAVFSPQQLHFHLSIKLLLCYSLLTSCKYRKTRIYLTCIRVTLYKVDSLTVFLLCMSETVKKRHTSDLRCLKFSSTMNISIRHHSVWYYISRGDPNKSKRAILILASSNVSYLTITMRCCNICS